MAHRRSYRRKHRRKHHARENPLSDTTKIVLAVGVTAAVVGVGYLLYKRSQSQSAGLLQPVAPQLPSPTQGQGGVQNQPPSGAPQSGSTQVGDAKSATSFASLTPQTVSAVSAIMAMAPAQGTRPKQAKLDWTPAVTSPTFDPNNPNP